MKKWNLIFILLICCFMVSIPFVNVYAKEQDYFVVYSDDGHILFEKEEVELGDFYISKDFKKYEIIKIFGDEKVGIAKFVEKLKVPSVRTYFGPNKINNISKKIGLYMTHNDESYVVGDGVDSIYGKGGIHDVAKAIKRNLEGKNIKVELDETVHAPHDNSAYQRSRKTASKLLKNNVDALFDIHRDGASRRAYVVYDKGIEKCKVRIVIGGGNENSSANQEFATYLMAVANEIHPWLIKDIYIGKNHYNQALYGKALLFEMGSHMVEKDLVIRSVEPLCEVINTALYETTINKEDGDLTINGNETKDDVLIKDIENLNEKNNSNNVLTIILVLLGIVVLVGGSFALNYYIDKKILSDD